MLKIVEISNFQSHKHSVLKFVPGVNVIIGHSDSGKTAIIRTIKWVTQNTPAGTSLRSHWGGDTSIKLTLEEGTQVERLRTNKINVYKIDKTILEAMKGKVPSEITNILNMNNISIQQQLDSPFLLSDSSGEVAKHFNKVAHLDVIDRGSSNIKKWLKQTEQNIKTKQTQIKTAKEELIKYDYLEQMEADVKLLESFDQEQKRTVQQLTTLHDLVKQIKFLEYNIKETSSIFNIENLVIKTLQKIGSLKIYQVEIKTIISTIKEIKTIEKDLQKNKSLLMLEKPIQALDNLQIEKRGLTKQTSTLQLFIDDLLNVTQEIKIATSKISILKKQMPSVCPFCGQEIKKEVLK